MDIKKKEIEINPIKNTITINSKILEEIKKYCTFKGLKIGKFIENISIEYIKKQSNES